MAVRLLNVIPSSPRTYMYEPTHQVITMQEKTEIQTEKGKTISIPAGYRVAIRKKKDPNHFFGTIILECIDMGIPVIVPMALLPAA